MSKLSYNKSKREEAQNSQLFSMNKALTQILNKQADFEKKISQFALKEKNYKETIEELTSIPAKENLDICRYDLVLKELESENQFLRDKLEAVENNISGFIKEMTELLENEEDASLPSDDDGFGDSQARSNRKKGNLIR